MAPGPEKDKEMPQNKAEKSGQDIEEYTEIDLKEDEDEELVEIFNEPKKPKSDKRKRESDEDNDEIKDPRETKRPRFVATPPEESESGRTTNPHKMFSGGVKKPEAHDPTKPMDTEDMDIDTGIEEEEETGSKSPPSPKSG